MKRVFKAAALALALAVLVAAGVLLFLIQRNLPSSSPPKIPGLSAKVSVAFDDRGVADRDGGDGARRPARAGMAHRPRAALPARAAAAARAGRARGDLRRRVSSRRTARTARSGSRRVAGAAVPLLPEGERADLEALTDGINAFLDARPGRLGLEFTLLGLSPKRFTPADALLVHLLMCEDLSTSWRRDLALEKLGRVDPAVRRFVSETASADDVLLVPDAAASRVAAAPGPRRRPRGRARVRRPARGRAARVERLGRVGRALEERQAPPRERPAPRPDDPRDLAPDALRRSRGGSSRA